MLTVILVFCSEIRGFSTGKLIPGEYLKYGKNM